MIEGGQRLFRLGYEAFITSGKVPQVEKCRLERFSDKLCEMFMPCCHQFSLCQASSLVKKRAGICQRLFLQIESPDLSTRPDQAGEKQGVAAIAAGRVHHPGSWPNPLSQEKVGEGHRAVQTFFNHTN